MRNNYFKLSFILSFVLLLGMSNVNAQVHITDADGLNDIRNDSTAHYILDNDIDLTDYAWVPPSKFSGILDGNGFAIKNLEVELNAEYVGFFGAIENGTVKNLGLEDVYIVGTNNVGALAGITATVTIENCYFSGEVTGSANVGGIVGFHIAATISKCFVTDMKVTGHDHVGGIVGLLYASTIENSYSNSAVYSDGWQVGGIAGWAQNADTKITKCISYGTVKSEGGFTGGILGIADGGDKVVDITECIAAHTKIETVNPDIAKTYRIIGAENAATFSNNFGLAGIELVDPNKLEWKDSADSKDGASVRIGLFTSANFYADSLTTWDFTDTWELTATGPKLKWDTFTTVESRVLPMDPIVITTAEELSAMRDLASESYILGNDIDLTGFAWEPFNFSGVLNGDNYSISNLEVEKSDGHTGGLFNILDGATIENLNIVDAYVLSSEWAGGLAFQVSGTTVENVMVTGEIDGGGLAGGFAAHSSKSTFNKCVTEAKVKGHDHVGGILGHMEGGLVVNCYSNSTVYSDAWQVGGIVGWAQNENTVIKQCVSYGTVKAEAGFTGGILGIADGGEKVVDITECIAAHTKIETVDPDIAKTYRIIGAENAATFSNNFGLAGIELVDPNKLEWKDSADSKDGASIMIEMFTSESFYSDSLTTWDFTDVWELTTTGPKLKWETLTTVESRVLPSDPDVAIGNSKVESLAKVYASNGTIYVNGAEENTKVSIYDTKGSLILESKINSSIETFNAKGFLIILIESSNVRSTYKVINY